MSSRKPVALPSFHPRTPRQKTYYDQILSNPVTFGVGPAGTGKTCVAAYAAAHLLETGKVDRLILTRPIVAVENEDLGAVPGDIDEKMAPWAMPVLYELEKVAGKERVRKWDIETAPIGLIRGRTFENAVVHVSEAQNLTLVQAKALVTRQGENCHMVIEGDPEQSDIPNSALLSLISLAAKGVDHALTEFLAEDVVRSRVVRQWLEVFAATPRPNRPW